MSYGAIGQRLAKATSSGVQVRTTIQNPCLPNISCLATNQSRALKPGSWLELRDIVPECKCDDSTMPSGQQYAPAKMMDLIKVGLSHFGVDLRAGSSQKNRIEAAGS